MKCDSKHLTAIVLATLLVCNPALATIDYTSNLTQYGAASGGLGFPVSAPEITDFVPVTSNDSEGPIGNTTWQGSGTGDLGENRTSYHFVNGTGFWGYPVRAMGMFYVPDLMISGGPDSSVDVQVRVDHDNNFTGTGVLPTQTVYWRSELRELTGTPIGSSIKTINYTPNSPTQTDASTVIANVPVGQTFSLTLATQWEHINSNAGVGLFTTASASMRLNPDEVFELPAGYTLSSPTLGIINNTIPTPITGDLNSDGYVGIDDLNLVLSNWNQNVPPGDPLADPSGDGFVGIDDLNEVLGNWNAGTPPPSEGADGTVPEPGTAVLLGLGVVSLGARRRLVGKL